jgi:4-hydroxy-tetrahydrodipicolinate reductase
MELAATRDDVRVASAVDHPASELIGREVCGVAVTGDLGAALAAADVYIDFTTPDATERAARFVMDPGGRAAAAVIGTTGLGSAAQAAVDTLSARAPVIHAPNFSLGVNVLLGLAERAARALGPAFDLEVVEIHHRHKRDAPSGTALALAAALQRGRTGGRIGDEAGAQAGAQAMTRRLSREGDVGPRSDDEIGVMAVRGGDVAGEHTAYLLGPDERVEITHRAGSRAIFAAGALHAALWLAGRPPGRYTMSDVLGL